MILNKANLAISQAVTAKDGDFGLLHVAEDGSTIVNNSGVVLICSPCKEEHPFTSDGADVNAEGVSVRIELVQQVLRTMSKSRLHAFTQLSEASKTGIEFTTTAPEREQRMTGLPIFRKFIPWRKYFSALGQAVKPDRRIAVSKHDLLLALKVMDKASEDRSKQTPVYIEQTRDPTLPIMLRMKNYASGQDLVAILPVLEIEEKNSGYSPWERWLFGLASSARRLVKRLKRKAVRKK